MNNNLENNLYYTPTIEEFHIGFEYEEYQFLERNWKTVKCEFIKPNTTIDPKWFRVKYLDQSDIESLGWESKGKSHFIKSDWILRKFEDGLIIYLDYYAGKLEHSWMYEDSVKILFEGTIKNKSELIKLMQQLNIK